MTYYCISVSRILPGSHTLSDVQVSNAKSFGRYRFSVKVEGKVCRWRRRESDRAKCISRLIWRLSARPLHVPAVTSARQNLDHYSTQNQYSHDQATHELQCPRPVLFSLRCGSLFCGPAFRSVCVSRFSFPQKKRAKHHTLTN